jgi:hypothetical protein
MKFLRKEKAWEKKDKISREIINTFRCINNSDNHINELDVYIEK